VTGLEDLDTPAVIVDLAVVEANIARMADRARARSVRLRPHAKTHKIPELGRLQLAAGACGLSLAKPSEARVFADAGFDDLFVAYPVVGKERLLLELADRVRLAVGVDSEPGARALARAFHAAHRRLDVLLKVDVGFHRVGVTPQAAPALARLVAELPGLRLRGVFTHAGHAYAAPDAAGVAAVGHDEAAILCGVAAELRGMGLGIEEVSVGSTPTAFHALTVPGVTECRPGNYVYHDASQVALGTCRLEDCALTVLATVVSVPAPDRAVVDAGSKTLSSDPLRPRPGGHGSLTGYRSRIARLSEEHGVIEVCPGERFEVGQRVRVLPNHACVVSNLHDRVHALRDGRVEAVWKVAARGCVT